MPEFYLDFITNSSVWKDFEKNRQFSNNRSVSLEQAFISRQARISTLCSYFLNSLLFGALLYGPFALDTDSITCNPKSLNYQYENSMSTNKRKWEGPTIAFVLLSLRYVSSAPCFMSPPFAVPREWCFWLVGIRCVQVGILTTTLQFMVGAISIGNAKSAWLVRFKGWTKENINRGLADARVGSVIMLLVTLMIMTTAAAVLRGKYLGSVAEVANSLQPFIHSKKLALLWSLVESSWIIHCIVMCVQRSRIVLGNYLKVGGGGGDFPGWCLGLAANIGWSCNSWKVDERLCHPVVQAYRKHQRVCTSNRSVLATWTRHDSDGEASLYQCNHAPHGCVGCCLSDWCSSAWCFWKRSWDWCLSWLHRVPGDKSPQWVEILIRSLIGDFPPPRLCSIPDALGADWREAITKI